MTTLAENATGTLGPSIKVHRQLAKLSQTKLGEQLGVDQPTVSHWEKSLYDPRAKQIKPLARALGITADELLDVEAARSKEGTARYLLCLAEQEARDDLSLLATPRIPSPTWGTQHSPDRAIPKGT